MAVPRSPAAIATDLAANGSLGWKVVPRPARLAAWHSRCRGQRKSRSSGMHRFVERSGMATGAGCCWSRSFASDTTRASSRRSELPSPIPIVDDGLRSRSTRISNAVRRRWPTFGATAVARWLIARATLSGLRSTSASRSFPAGLLCGVADSKAETPSRLHQSVSKQRTRKRGGLERLGMERAAPGRS